MKRLRVRDRVITSHDVCTSETSLVLIVASLQRLKMEWRLLFNHPPTVEVRSVIEVFECTEHCADRNSSSAVPGLWPHTARRSTHLLQEFGRKYLIIIHPIARTSRPVISIYSYTLRNFCLVSASVFGMTGGDESHNVRLLRHRIQKLVPRYDRCLNSGGEYV